MNDPNNLRKLTRKELAAKFPLTEADLKELRDSALQVWNDIGYDVLQAMPRNEMKKAEVIEVVLDANRFSEEVRLSTRTSPQLKALFPAIWNRDAHDYVHLLMKDIFIDRVYGM